MIDLDDVQAYEDLDPSHMLERIGELPHQCSEAWRSALAFRLPPGYASVDKVVILGMGGSAIGGDMLRGLACGEGAAEVCVHRDYHLPPSVGERTLVIASSYSGNTEETLSAFSQALDTPAKTLAITTGGRLEAMARSKDVPVYCFKYDGEPRTAFGYSFFSLLAIAHKLRLVSVSPDDVDRVIRLLEGLTERYDRATPLSENPAKQMATSLHDRLGVVYGAGILSPVAFRWKTQLNENSKASAFSESFPELNHNAVVGYRFPTWLSDKLLVVMLRSPLLHRRVLKRYEVTAELLRQAGLSYTVFDAEGESALGQMMSAVRFGDFVSYYLAILNGVAPSPVAAIDYLKQRMAEGET
ncbi:MAG: bifunctional phosphoglucose/phosphomannose isomerase [Chloroflexota bacterium]|nr:bifunctional phosphoglucose/phosphomannose isomerase [Chloroflexota bacterium]